MTPWLVVLVPVIGSAIVARIGRGAHAVAAGALGVTAALALWAAATEASSVASWTPRLELTLAATNFARVMTVLVPVIALPIVLYAAATETVGPRRLVALLTAFVGAMELLVLANDFVTLLIGWELVGALSWILIAHDTRVASNGQRASHAFITTRVGDLGLYIAAGMAFAATGSFAFDDISRASASGLHIVAAGILLAASAKSAQVPFSPWLFSAMAGPTPVSALLHSSTMVAAGAYLLVRLGPRLTAVEWFAPAVIAIGLAGALGGGIIAALDRHPKRLLAASTTAQYGLMFIAIGAGSVLAAGAQLVTHAAFKSLLFLTAGTAMRAARSDDLAEMRVGRRLPVAAALAGIGALALAGVPPLGGAWSKEQVAGAAFELSPVVGALVLGASLLGAFYALRYWVLAFGANGARAVDATDGPVAAPMGALAAVSLALGALWIPPINHAAARLAGGEVVPTHALELALGLASIGVGAAMVVALARRSRLAQGAAPAALAGAAVEWFLIPAASRRVVVEPVLALSRGLAAFDDRVIDAGVRASARVAAGLSRLLRRRSELSIDALVNAVGGGTLHAATGARVTDDRGVDRAVEAIAGGLGRAGALLRRLQTGLSHHYYVLVAIGVTALVAALATGRS